MDEIYEYKIHIEHTAYGRPVNRSRLDGEADDLPSKLIHDDHHPVRLEDERFTSKEIHTPQTVFAMAQESEPGRTVGARLRHVVLGQNAPYQVLVNLNVEDQGNLIGYTLVAKLWVPVFHFDDHGDQFCRGPFGTGLTTSLRCEEKAVLPFYQCAVEANYRGRLQDKG